MMADNIPSTPPQGLNSVITLQQTCCSGSVWYAMKFTVFFKVMVVIVITNVNMQDVGDLC